jgi:hypothetical protein
MMKRFFLILSIILILFSLPVFSYASEENIGKELPPEIIYKNDNLAFSLRTELGATYHSVHWSYDGTYENQGEHFFDWGTSQKTGDMTVGGTLFYDKFTLDAYIRTSLTEGQHTDPTGSGEKITDYSRQEYSLSVNYLFTENLACFIGLRYEHTKVSSEMQQYNEQNNSKFDIYGPTIGLAYLFNTKNSPWKHSVHGGIAYMIGNLDLESFNSKCTDRVSTLGYLLGYNVRYIINNHWDIGFTLDAYYFDFGTIEWNDGVDGEFHEEVLSGRLGVTYTF